jgi:hypothetical protein
VKYDGEPPDSGTGERSFDRKQRPSWFVEGNRGLSRARRAHRPTLGADAGASRPPPPAQRTEHRLRLQVRARRVVAQPAGEWSERGTRQGGCDDARCLVLDGRAAASGIAAPARPPNGGHRVARCRSGGCVGRLAARSKCPGGNGRARARGGAGRLGARHRIRESHGRAGVHWDARIRPAAAVVGLVVRARRVSRSRTGCARAHAPSPRHARRCADRPRDQPARRRDPRARGRTHRQGV